MHAPPSSTRWRQPDMFGAIISFVTGLLGKLLGSLFGKKDPTPVELATAATRAQDVAAQEGAANEVLDKASRDRNDAGADIMRIESEPHADDAATRDAIAKQFPDDFRD